MTFDREFIAPMMNTTFELPPRKLPDNHSTSISTSSSIPISFSKPVKCPQDIRKVIFNDREAQLNPQRESEYKKNFTKLNKEDYRVKRNQTYYPNNPMTLGKETVSEYHMIYNKNSN